MTPMTDEEWQRVTDALVRGGLRDVIDSLLTTRPFLSEENRKIIDRAYDDGDGHGITLVPTDDPPWFAGMYEDSEVMLGMEHRGILYSIVHGSGGGVSSVIVGEGLVENEIGVAFYSVNAAKAHVKDLTAK